jgi:hypothetical protein
MLEVMVDVTGDLLERGWARRRNALSHEECVRLRDLYTQESLFRSRVVMERHSYGSGEYKYFASPLPERVAALRASLYDQLMPVANRWNELLRLEQRYPSSLQDYLAQCHKAGQTRPTPLMLRYRTGDYNCLHQDTYGELAFPFQATLFLSGRSEYEGGEFVLVEQRPRAQSKPIVITPEQGDCIIIPNRHRPVQGKRGIHRTTFRHGVSEIRRGERYALGLIFHDAT